MNHLLLLSLTWFFNENQNIDKYVGDVSIPDIHCMIVIQENNNHSNPLQIHPVRQNVPDNCHYP